MSNSSRNNQGNDSNKKGNGNNATNNKRLIITISAISAMVIIVLLLVIIVLLAREPNIVYEPVVQLIEGPGRGGYERNTGGRGFVVTEDNVEYVREQLESRRVEPGDMHFTFSHSAEWRFPTSLARSTTAFVENVERNSRTVFFDVYIEGFGVVYASPFMPLGSSHRNFALEVEVPVGRYDAQVTYFLVDDDLEIITDVTVGVTIVIER